LRQIPDDSDRWKILLYDWIIQLGKAFIESPQLPKDFG
jgi:hypothetical protein